MENKSLQKTNPKYLLAAGVIALSIVTLGGAVAFYKVKIDQGQANLQNELPVTGIKDPEPNFGCDEFSYGKTQVVNTTRWVCEDTGWQGYSL
ncbi:MAG: hypothetical protein WCJ58_00350 [bacterium]